MKIKKILYLLLTIVLVLGFSFYSKNKAAFNAKFKVESGKEITFFVATDIHYVSKEINDGKEAFKKFFNEGDGRQLDYIDEILEGLSNDIKKKKPEVLIISGDLTSNGEKKNHEELARKLKKIEDFGTSVFVIPGNHDIQNPFARGFKENMQYRVNYVNAREFSKIYGKFGYNDGISRDKTTLSYLAAPSEDVWLLMLDTAKYQNNENLGYPEVSGMISSDTYDWIKECSNLARKKNAQIITVMHHNLLDHSNVLKEGYTLDNNMDAVKIFQENDINLVLSGHVHVQDIESYEKDGKVIYDLVTSSLGVYPQQYGVLKYSPANGYDYSTSSVDVEGWAKESGITDTNLINFKEYSKNFFGEKSYKKTNDRLLLADIYTDEERKLMADTMREVNFGYFSGTLYEKKEEIMSSAGYKLWLTAGDGFSRGYITRIINKTTSDNKLHVDNFK